MTVPVSSPSHPGVWRPPWLMTATNTAIPAIAEPIKMNNVVHEGFFCDGEYRQPPRCFEASTGARADSSALKNGGGDVTPARRAKSCPGKLWITLLRSPTVAL